MDAYSSPLGDTEELGRGWQEGVADPSPTLLIQTDMCALMYEYSCAEECIPNINNVRLRAECMAMCAYRAWSSARGEQPLGR